MRKEGENIYKRKDGRFEGRYLYDKKPDGKPKFIYAYGKDRAEVKKKLKEAIRKHFSGAPSQPKHTYNHDASLTVSAMFQRFMETTQENVKQSTFTRYSFIIEKHIIPTIGAVKVSQLTAEKLSGFLDEKLASGRLDGKGGLSPKSVRDIWVLMKSALKHAGVEFDLDTVIRKVKLSRKKHKNIEIFTEVEVKAINAQAFTDNKLSSLPIFLALNTGLRLGEVCALRISDFDFMNNMI